MELSINFSTKQFIIFMNICVIHVDKALNAVTRKFNQATYMLRMVEYLII